MIVSDNNNTNDNYNILKELQNFGKFQMLQYFFICLPVVMVSMIHVNYVFVAEDVNYRCLVQECEADYPTIDSPTWWPDDTPTKCMKPVLNIKAYDFTNQTCFNTSFINTLEECQEWVYENNNSIVAELNLGCQPWKATLVGSIHNAGMIFSMMFTGWIADKIGRKPTIIICSVGGCIGVFKIFVTNYYVYLTLEFLESFIASGLYTVAVILLIEAGGETKRVLTGVIFSYAVYVGEVAFAFVAMGFKYWKSIILVVYTPMILFLFYGFILRESTRWQMLRGKIEEAKKTLKLIAKANKINITDAEITDTNDKELRLAFNVEEQKQIEDMKSILDSKEIMIRLSVASFCFFTSSFLYYSLIVYSVLLPGNKYMNFILASLTSFPGDLIAYYTLNKLGRRITLQCGYLFSALSLIAQNYCPEAIAWMKILLFLIGKLGVVVCFTGIYTYSLELFPTSVRGSLFGCGNTVARFGSMLAPFTPLLMTAFTSLPSILFSLAAIISAILLSFVPETKSLPMFDTIAQIGIYKETFKK